MALSEQLVNELLPVFSYPPSFSALMPHHPIVNYNVIIGASLHSYMYIHYIPHPNPAVASSVVLAASFYHLEKKNNNKLIHNYFY